MSQSRPTEVEAIQWTTGEGDHTRHRAEWVVNWVLANGGEANYIAAGPLALATGQKPLIAVRTINGWAYAAPGHYVVMDGAAFDVLVEDSTGGVSGSCETPGQTR